MQKKIEMTCKMKRILFCSSFFEKWGGTAPLMSPKQPEPTCHINTVQIHEENDQSYVSTTFFWALAPHKVALNRSRTTDGSDAPLSLFPTLECSLLNCMERQPPPPPPPKPPLSRPLHVHTRPSWNGTAKNDTKEEEGNKTKNYDEEAEFHVTGVVSLP